MCFAHDYVTYINCQVIDVIALRKKYKPDGLTVTAIFNLVERGAPKLALILMSEAKASCSHLLELLTLHESADSADAILLLLEKTHLVAKKL